MPSPKIGLATATIIGMNAVIGSGIFSAPAAMASNVGPAGILAYILVIISVWFIALSFARLSYLFPEEGSFYTYASPWAGHAGGILACCAYLTGLFIAMGLLSQIVSFYLHSLMPNYSSYALGLFVLTTLVILNLFGVILSEWGQRILIVCTVFPLVATTILCLTNINLSYLTPFAPYGFGNVLKATRIVIFGFFGFESATSLFNLVENPRKNVPLALTYTILLVGLLYTLFIASIILSTPPALFNSSDIVVTDILSKTFPTHAWLIMLIHLSIVSAIVGTIHAMIWGSSTLVLALIKKLTSVPARALMHSRLFNQRAAVLLVGFFIFLTYTTLKNLDLFFNLTACCVVFAYIMAMITLLTIKQEWKTGHNIITLAGLATAGLIFMFAAEGLVQEIIKII